MTSLFFLPMIMRNSVTLAITTLLTVLATSPAHSAPFKVRADKENVVASKIAGHWELDELLTKRLGGSGIRKVSFHEDATVVEKIPAKYEEFLGERAIYMAGKMVIDEEVPFILIEYKGNPTVVFFRERDGDPLGDAESFNVMLAPGKNTQDDLLFIGGDFNNQPFSALRRAMKRDDR
jgi:hypothetical protein